MLRSLCSAVVLVSLAVTGCSGASEDAPPRSEGSTAASSGPSRSPSPSPSVDAKANGSAAAGVGLEALANPVATVEAKTGMEKDPEGTARVDILGLKRKDRLLVLTAAVTPTTSLAEPQSLFRVLGSHSWAPTLVDSANLKQYSVVRSGNKRLASADLSVKAGSGQPMFVYAVFAAPPPEVTTINVLFADTIPALTDVPIQ